ncbi:nucleotide sugar dehydrogenase [Puniceicoccaceae bacterium K14]|nr:nucleotide sugar dehydrogenase [Puniceicoccaceae bacterium K14]
MKISVFGMGYVGVVTAACFAKEGHLVYGVDISQQKLDLIKSGKSPIIEEQIEDLIRNANEAEKLVTTTDAEYAISESELAIVCVGTPSREDGSLDTQYVEAVTKEIGLALKERNTPFTFVLRSTVLPGTLKNIIIPILEESSGLKSGENLNVIFHPEFLRESSSVKDFYDPPKIVIGEATPGCSRKLLDMYENFDAPLHITPLEVAEMVKYSDNIFHALKITFANEIGQLCHCSGIDSRAVMNVFCTDTKLNISPAYLRPGFAFGGSCLPKDLRAFLALARSSNAKTPMLENVLVSNQLQIERVVNLTKKHKATSIGFYGLAFKKGTDDLRESPLVELAERMLGKGYQLNIYDSHVQINRLVGKNKAYIDAHFPHLARLMCENPIDLLESDLLFLGHNCPNDLFEKYLKSNIQIIDLTGQNRSPNYPNYESIV